MSVTVPTSNCPTIASCHIFFNSSFIIHLSIGRHIQGEPNVSVHLSEVRYMLRVKVSDYILSV
jgi:hypothetical protein